MNKYRLVAGLIVFAMVFVSGLMVTSNAIGAFLAGSVLGLISFFQFGQVHTSSPVTAIGKTLLRGVGEGVVEFPCYPNRSANYTGTPAAPPSPTHNPGGRTGQPLPHLGSSHQRCRAGIYDPGSTGHLSREPGCR